MAYQNFFKRYEVKYLITQSQREKLLNDMGSYIEVDQYGRTTIRNIYFDTDNYLLVRRSIEKPCYKEKLRLRCYGVPEGHDKAFVEIKKKFESVVYKRRVALPYENIKSWETSPCAIPVNSQICEEINYFIDYYKKLVPKVFLSYERTAYRALGEEELRVTFDDNILARCDELELDKDIGGENILDSEYSLMEIKTPSSVPLWLTHILAENNIYPASFSKYGTAYAKLICANRDNRKYA